LASLPKASAADYYIDGTLSNKSGLSNAITPADWRASIFYGRVASSATVYTN